VAAIAFVDIGALDRAAGELLGGFDDPAERVPVIRVSRQRPGMKHELPARPARALVGGTSPLIGAPETFALLATSDMSGKTEVAALERHVRCTSRADIVGPSRHVRIVPSRDNGKVVDGFGYEYDPFED